MYILYWLSNSIIECFRMSFLFLLAMTEGMPTEYSPKSTHPLGDIGKTESV